MNLAASSIEVKLHGERAPLKKHNKYKTGKTLLLPAERNKNVKKMNIHQVEICKAGRIKREQSLTDREGNVAEQPGKAAIEMSSLTQQGERHR